MKKTGPKGKHISSILVIDDESAVRKVCDYILRHDNYNVFLAENGMSGLETLRANPEIEIVLTDLRMPILDGMSVLSKIKKDMPHIEVIIMTGFATIENAIQAMKDGAYDFILKPLKPDQIRLVVEKCLKSIKLSEENIKLRRANEKLREVQEMKEKFLAITSHELRTPVSHLKGYFAILNDDFFHELEESEKQSCISVIQSALKDLEELVNKMFETVRLHNESLSLAHDDVDLLKLLTQVVDEFRLAAMNRSLNLEFGSDSQHSNLTADRLKLKGLFSELVSNAIKFTPDGGKISIFCSEEEKYYKIIVADSGIGIHADAHSKIFEPFYEVQDSDYHSTGKTSFKGGGLGLGLALAKEIVLAHKGIITVESEVDRGSKFMVFLPRKPVENKDGI